MTAWHLVLQTIADPFIDDRWTIDSAGSVAGRLSPDASTLTVQMLGLAMVAVFTTAIACALVHFLKARRDVAAGRRKGPIAPGRVVLRGEVEAVAEPGPVVALSIEQTGCESQSRNGIITQLWTETDRRLSVRPFYLVLPSGERVRVEPDDGVRLAGRIEHTERLDAAQRRRVMEVSPGASITVSGILERGHDPGTPGEGYRGSGAGFVLRAPPRGSVHISLASASRERSARSSFHLRWAAVIVIAFIAIQAGLFLHFHLLRMHGEVVIANITDMHERRARRETQFFIDASYTDPQGKTHLLHGQVSTESMGTIRSLLPPPVGYPMKAAFLWLASSPSIHQAGTRPTIESHKRGAALFFLIIVVFAYGAHAFYTRPWNARRRLVETDRSRL